MASAFDIQGRDALSTTANADSWAGFDHSGWNVNFGSGSVDSARNDPLASSGVGNMLPYAVLAVGLLIAWRMTRKT